MCCNRDRVSVPKVLEEASSNRRLVKYEVRCWQTRQMNKAPIRRETIENGGSRGWSSLGDGGLREGGQCRARRGKAREACR